MGAGKGYHEIAALNMATVNEYAGFGSGYLSIISCVDMPPMPLSHKIFMISISDLVGVLSMFSFFIFVSFLFRCKVNLKT